MVDEEIEDVPTGPTGAPVNRDARREPEVIEGEVAAREADDSKSPPYSTAPETSADPPPAAEPVRGAGARGILGGAVAGLIVSALALGAGYTLLAPKTDLSDAPNRLSALETQARQTNDAIAAETNRESAAIAALEKRIGALESSAGARAPGAADLEKRVTALEAASGGNSAASDATQRLESQAKDLRADIDAEKSQLPDLSARVAKLESDASKPNTNVSSADLAALAARVDKIEAALAAPKPDTRSPTDTDAAIAVVADAAKDRLRAGAPLGPDLTALQHLGVDAAALAPLQAVANGAPTNSALAASFSAVAPHVLAAAAPQETGGVTDRFLAHLHNLVKVRELNETAGDDPQALVSQIEAETRRGDIADALAAFDKLPEAARKAAGDWPTLARARQAADAALLSIREGAVGRLAGGPKP
jgi:hypothetical protein